MSCYFYIWPPIYIHVPVIFLLWCYHKWIPCAPNRSWSTSTWDFMTLAHSRILFQSLFSFVPLNFISFLLISHQHTHILFSLSYLTSLAIAFFFFWAKLLFCLLLLFVCFSPLFIQDFTPMGLLKNFFQGHQWPPHF